LVEVISPVENPAAVAQAKVWQRARSRSRPIALRHALTDWKYDSARHAAL
jgi:hypothetical protein